MCFKSWLLMIFISHSKNPLTSLSCRREVAAASAYNKAGKKILKNPVHLLMELTFHIFRRRMREDGMEYSAAFGGLGNLCPRERRQRGSEWCEWVLRNESWFWSQTSCRQQRRFEEPLWQKQATYGVPRIAHLTKWHVSRGIFFIKTPDRLQPFPNCWSKPAKDVLKPKPTQVL